MKVLKYNICTMLDLRRRRWADVVQMFVFQSPSAVSFRLLVKVVVVAGVWCVILLESRQS